MLQAEEEGVRQVIYAEILVIGAGNGDGHKCQCHTGVE